MRPKSFIIIFITYVYNIDIPTMGSHKGKSNDYIDDAKRNTRELQDTKTPSRAPQINMHLKLKKNNYYRNKNCHF